MAEVMERVAASVLDRVDRAAVRRAPYPYLVVDDALPAAEFEALSRTYPDARAMPAGRFEKNNHRYNLLSDWGAAEFPLEQASPEWRAFIARHSSADFVRQVFDVFSDYTVAAHGAARLRTDALGPGLAQAMKVDAEIPLDAIKSRVTVAVNTPVREVSRVRGIHTDAKRKAYVGLLYFRTPEDDSTGGDLEVFGWRDGAKREGWPVVVDEDRAVLAETVGYKANRFVLFPTTHDALHAVSPRGVTDHVRRLVVISGWLPNVDHHETDTTHGRLAGIRSALFAKVRHAIGAARA